MRRRLWSTTLRNDDAFAWLDASPGFFSDDPHGENRLTPDGYFWMVAHRAIPCFDARPWGPEHNGIVLDEPYLPGREKSEEYARVNRLYLAVLPFMHRLRLTEGGKHTLWLDAEGRPVVVWAFERSSIGFSGPVLEVETKRAIETRGDWTAEAGQVYLLGRRTLFRVTAQ